VVRWFGDSETKRYLTTNSLTTDYELTDNLIFNAAKRHNNLLKSGNKTLNGAVYLSDITDSDQKYIITLGIFSYTEEPRNV
jgi:HD superfamily phosphohydrolase YqeK